MKIESRSASLLFISSEEKPSCGIPEREIHKNSNNTLNFIVERHRRAADKGELTA